MKRKKPLSLPGVDELNSINISPRIIKTHLPVQFLPQSFWEQNSKVQYVDCKYRAHSIITVSPSKYVFFT